MIARDLLRYCALEALRPSSILNDVNPVFPTLAGKYVADSRIDPVDDVGTEERRPLIGVFTETSRLEPLAQAGNLYSGFVDLVFELSVVQKFPDPDPNTRGNLITDFCDTDAAVEATLSSLEDSVFFCLHFGPTGALFRKMVKLADKANYWHSEPHRSGEESIRLGRRCVTFHVRMREVNYEPAPSGTPANLMRLPPQLRPIADALGNSSYIADLVRGLAKSASVMPPRVNLNTVAATIEPEPGNATE